MKRLLNFAMIAIVLLASAHEARAQNILYDNGPSFGRSKGLSIWTPPNPRRSLLDDFELPPGGGTVDAWSTWMVWDLLQGTGHATKVELTFYGDANGAPDFDDLLAFVTTTDITEVLEGSQIFHRDIIIMTARFPGVFIPDGRLWVDMIWFEPTGEKSALITSEIKFTESWTDYEDFPPPGPGRNVFGVDSDLIFTLFGTVGGGGGLNGTFDCPIGGGVATLNLSGGTAGGRVGVAVSFSNIGFTIPIGPCAGTIIATAPPYLGGTPILSKFDANGDLSLSTNVPSGLCADIFVSAIDLTTCDVVNLPP